MPNLVNTLLVRELTDAFRESTGLVIVSLNGLTMAENEALRESLAEGGVPLRMVRNSLALIALKECGFALEQSLFQGNIAVAYGTPEHAIHAAKVLSKPDVKKTGKVELRGGVLEGQVLDRAAVSQLAELPDRDTLRARVLGVLSGPARSLVGIINAPIASFARVVQARVDAAPKDGAPQGGSGEAA